MESPLPKPYIVYPPVTSPVGAPHPSPPPRAPSFSARLAPVAAPSGPDGAIEAEVRRALFQRLLGESARAEIAHLLVCTVVAVLLWPSVPHVELAVWGGAIGACTLTRELLRRRLSSPTASVESGEQRIRLVLAVTGLAWGVGAAAFMPSLAL